jgi:hypothetical protein
MRGSFRLNTANEFKTRRPGYGPDQHPAHPARSAWQHNLDGLAAHLKLSDQTDARYISQCLLTKPLSPTTYYQ